ncbi:MAG: hypothetical protein WCY89_06365 [Flavobacteriaceae bacterium]
MTANRNTGEVITLTEAVDFTHSFQTANPNAIKAFLVGEEKLDLILKQRGCIGIRIYNGQENNKNNLVLVGVDENGEDMTNGVIVEHLNPCPPDCSKTSALLKP